MPHSTPAECPRCGYDLSGAVATWTTECPTSGTCSECGLELEWRDVLNPKFRRLKGFYEHAASALGPFSLVRSLAWCVIPWVFWTRVRMHHAVHWKRVAKAAVITYLLAKGLQGVETAAHLSVIGLPAAQNDLRFINWSTNRSLGSVYSRPVHFDSRLIYLRGFFEPLVRIGFDGYPAWTGTTLTTRTPVTIECGWGWSPLLARAAFLSGFPLCFSVLPYTRRQARLKREHILRAASWSVFAFAPPMVVTTVVAFAVHTTVWMTQPQTGLSPIGVWIDGWLRPIRWLNTIFPFLWITCWWLAACTKGWRLHRGAAVCAAQLIISALFAAIVAVISGMYL